MSRNFGKRILNELAKHATLSHLYFSDYDEWKNIISCTGPKGRIYDDVISHKQRDYDYFIYSETNIMKVNLDCSTSGRVGNILYYSVEEWMDKYDVSRRIAIMMKILFESEVNVPNCNFNVNGICIDDLVFLMDSKGILD